jgi:hypothetical protein
MTTSRFNRDILEISLIGLTKSFTPATASRKIRCFSVKSNTSSASITLASRVQLMNGNEALNIPILDEATSLLKVFPFHWGFVGGWGIDCALGKITHPHKVVDVTILRPHASLLLATLPVWLMVCSQRESKAIEIKS